MMKLDLDTATRGDLWQQVVGEMERYHDQISEVRVAPVLDIGSIRDRLSAFDFERGMPPSEAVCFAVNGMWRDQVHTPHPRYFGLFNPAPTSMGIAGDALVAAFNPQIAAWSHSPFASEVERHLILALGRRFGYPGDAIDGVFASGGAEANHTAVLCALTHASPRFAREGVRAMASSPLLYVSALSHDSVLKAARLCGLGTDAVRIVAVDSRLRLAPETVGAAMERDRAAGNAPIMLVATAGSTSAGVIDDIAGLGAIARRHGAWFHVDAAWGGMAALLPELYSLLDGIGQADSITFDAHKSLSTPMGAGIFLTRHPDILEHTFRVNADYMPRDGASQAGNMIDPFAHSMQWSRRFTGLKLFLSLAVAGWEGYAGALRHQVAMGERLCRQARADGWKVVNDTPLPLALLTDGGGVDAAAVAQAVVASGEAWVSSVRLPSGAAAIRACITNYRTQPADVDALIASLGRARAALGSASGGAQRTRA
ncbi:MAG TPA: aminotransferase class V-fold PLP-dependent enzyme [Terriglobales bacterium]|nr:aminotransferase class V-fold PLP-dependent enzyme [Terriglobales bacterium]